LVSVNYTIRLFILKQLLTDSIKSIRQMVLEKIKWPTEDEDEDSDVSLEDTCRITGFLRTFIQNGKLIETFNSSPKVIYPSQFGFLDFSF